MAVVKKTVPAKKTAAPAAAKKTPVKKTDGLKSVVLKISVPDAGAVSVAGTFNHWSMDAHPMKKDKSGVWTKSLRLEKGVHQYKFVVDGHWRTDPSNHDTAPNDHGTLNSVLTV